MNGNEPADATLTSAKPPDVANSDAQAAARITKERPSNSVGSLPAAKILPADPARTKLTNGDRATNDEAESEAETLITSPVKNQQAAKHNAGVKQEHDLQHNESGHDAEADAPGSEDEGHNTIEAPARSENIMDMDGESSDALSDMSDEDDQGSHSSMSRNDPERTHGPGNASSNPRKRKHRVSSVSRPNKRQSTEEPRRRLRGPLPSEDALFDHERSDSPKSRTHRRAASSQSFLDGTDASGHRKRRSGPQFSSHGDSKQARWEESSISSEATSHGNYDQRRPQRGVVRSTSGAGRPVGREHKRHINKYGFTRLAEACESGDVSLVKEWREKDAEQLELAEFAGNKPLQIAALNGNAEVVEYLIAEGCQVDCANVDKDTPLIDAAENGHVDVVNILLKAGVDPLRQNLKGQHALDVVSDDTQSAKDIRAALRAAIEHWSSTDENDRREEAEYNQRLRAGPAKELHFMARTYENLLRLVTINDRNGVREFLDARVPVDNAVIAAAAKTGDLYLTNMLLAEMTEKKRSQKAEKPMLSVIGTSHFEMVKSLTELDQFNPLWTNRQGKKWSEIAEERAGPMRRQEMELLERLEREAANKPVTRRSSSPVMRRSDGKHKRLSISKADEAGDEISDEDMADDDTPRRKNGRRLLSRKDMRAASRRTDGSESEDDNKSEKMKAPSPKDKRGPGRPRTKGIGEKREQLEGKDFSQQDDTRRRRSSSSKHTSEKVLPSVPVVAPEAMDTGDKIDLPTTNTNIRQTATPAEDANKQRLREAAEAAKQQADLRKQMLIKQEQVLKEAQRQKAAQEAKQRQLEADIERQRQLDLAAMDAVRSRTRQQLLQQLPEPLSWLLDPKSDFSYDERGAMDTILRICEPIQVVYASDLDPSKSHTDFAEPLVLNLAVAPLLGKGIGLQLLLPEDAIDPSIHTTLLAQSVLPGVLVETDNNAARQCLKQLLFATELVHRVGQQDEAIVNGIEDDFNRELAQTAANFRARAASSNKLHSATALALRWLPLQQIVDRLHPVLRERDIRVREEWRTVLRQRLTKHEVKSDSEDDFFAGLCKQWEKSASLHTVRHNQKVVSRARPQVVEEKVDVIRGK